MDYYEILQVDDEATQEDIKKSYQQLILKHHPDKNQGNIELFIKIDEAYKVLKEPAARKEYDSKRFHESDRCQMVIHDTVRKNEFIYDNDDKVHYYVCKCGDWYILDEEADESEYLISCNDCSLVIKVLNS